MNSVSNLLQKEVVDVGGHDTHLTGYRLCNGHRNLCILLCFTPKQFCDRNIPYRLFHIGAILDREIKQFAQEHVTVQLQGNLTPKSMLFLNL